MSIAEIAELASPFALPLTTKFRQTTIRTGVVIGGPTGWGEFAPFPEYDDEVSGRWLAAALEAAFGKFPEKVRSQIPVNAIVPILDVSATTAAVTNAVTNYGMTTFKIKVADGTSTSLDNDVARVKTVRKTLAALGIEGKIRIDANGAWSALEAIEQLTALNEAAEGLDYVEQPCASISELRELRNLMQSKPEQIQIAVDESLRSSGQVEVSEIREVADLIILKAIPLGGVTAALNLATEIGLPVVVSGSLDTSVGLSSGIALAASIPNLYGACGLGTGLLLAADLVAETTAPVDGMLQVRRCAPDATLLSQAGTKVSTDERQWWRDRIVRSWQASACELVSSEIREAVES